MDDYVLLGRAVPLGSVDLGKPADWRDMVNSLAEDLDSFEHGRWRPVSHNVAVVDGQIVISVMAMRTVAGGEEWDGIPFFLARVAD